MNIHMKLSVFLLSAVVLTACQEEKKPAELPPRPVLSMIAEPAPALSLVLSGTIAARVETEFGFRILGRVVARDVHVGDLVKRGDILAAIDPLSLELAVKSAQSDLANNLAQLANATSNEERQQKLFEKQSSAQATLETAQQERKTAAANVAKAQANLDKAAEQLGYSRLLAEFDGVVTATAAEVGQVVSAGQSVVTVARPDERDAIIDVPEGGMQSLKPGSSFDVVLQLDSTIRAKGVVREIAPEADDATRTHRAKLSLVDPPSTLRLGSVITATANTEAVPVIRLPSSSVLSEGAATFVFVVDPAAAAVSRRAVRIDGEIVDGSTITISEGIRAGERVVVAGVHKLEDGQSIRIDQEINP